MVGVVNGFADRIGHALCMGMVRFENSDKLPLWRIQVRKNFGDPIIDEDATHANLVALKAWADRAIEALGTDGGRIDALSRSVQRPEGATE